jgi:hypothetical protein
MAFRHSADVGHNHKCATVPRILRHAYVSWFVKAYSCKKVFENIYLFLWWKLQIS